MDSAVKMQWTLLDRDGSGETWRIVTADEKGTESVYTLRKNGEYYERWQLVFIEPMFDFEDQTHL